MNKGITRAVTQLNGDGVGAVFQQNISYNINREIYLTFDDGIEAGTEDVVDLLDKKGVRGTFFLIGKQIESAYKRDKSLCLRVLNKIYNNHAIGNHSYSHANEFYSSFYTQGGVRIDKNEKIRRGVVADFAKAKNVILYYLALANGQTDSPTTFDNHYPAAKNQKKGLLRFPGTNTWYINDGIKDIKCTTRGQWKLCETDTEEHAEILVKAYAIFGWDCEWTMTVPTALSDKIRTSIQRKIDDNTIDFNDLDHINPYFDLYSQEYIQLNRPVESVTEMRDRLLDLLYKSSWPFDNVAKTPEKVVLLMHDRQFRKGKLLGGAVNLNDTTYLDNLDKLITYFQSIKAKFNTLDEY